MNTTPHIMHAAEDPTGQVTTFQAGSVVNVTFHLAYPHRVGTASLS